MRDERESLARAICSAAYLRGDFVLRSGQAASYYFDKYRFESDPALLRRIAAALRPLVPDGVDLLGGLELGGVPIATALSLESGIPTLFVRKKPKEYGTRKLAEGPPLSGRRVVVIEDVVTSGGQVEESVAALREGGAVVEEALCVVDREAGGHERLGAAGVELRSLFTLSTLAPWLPT